MARNDSNEDEQKENLGNDSDDTFGLPEIEYKPINREEEQTTSSSESSSEPEQVETHSAYEYHQSEPKEEREVYSSYSAEEENPSIWPKIFGILLVIVLALSAVLYFMWYKPSQVEKERLAKEQQEQESAQKEKDRLAALEASKREEAERRKADSLANITKVGIVEALTAPTGRYYVVITSAVDGDLIMDHAKKLSSTGVSCKVIPPFGKFKFYRLTIADGDTFAAAQEIANSKKAEFGDTWVLKY